MNRLRALLWELNIWVGMLSPWIFAVAYKLDWYRTGYYDLAIFLALLTYSVVLKLYIVKG